MNGDYFMTTSKILTSIAVMAVMTYCIRVLPMAIFRKKIQNRFVQSFLAYVPYAVLSAMTFPAIFSCTDSTASAAAGCAAAVILAYLGKSLLTVAVGASVVVYLVQLFLVF
ncbi:MAG: AzlD domain-containing protein [bacterium]|nr:AzlD domain-containing protein [bacterium]